MESVANKTCNTHAGTYTDFTVGSFFGGAWEAQGAHCLKLQCRKANIIHLHMHRAGAQIFV